MSSVELSQVLLEHLAVHARTRGASLALAHKARGRWWGFDWRFISDEVGTLAHGLHALGVRAGDRVDVLSSARPRTLLAALAAQALGATPVATDGGPAANRPGQPATSGARFAITDQQANLERLLRGDEQGALEAILHDDRRSAHPAADARLRSYDHVFADGQRRRADGALLSPAMTDAGALPTGLWAGVAADPAGPEVGPADRLVLLERLSAASTAPLLARWISSGALLALPEPEGDAEGDRREISPTTLIASSEWFNRLWLETEARLPPPGRAGRRLVERALNRGGQNAPARWLVLRPLARGLGLARARAALVLGETPAPGAQRLLAALGLLAPPARSPATSNPLSPFQAKAA